MVLTSFPGVPGVPGNPGRPRGPWKRAKQLLMRTVFQKFPPCKQAGFAVPDNLVK